MKIVEALEVTHRPWLHRVARHLARGEELRANVENLLEQFYGRLKQTMETGDPGWLDPILESWVGARTQSELESREFSLPAIFNQMQLITYEIAQENLADADTVALMGALLPVYLHAIEFTTRLEMERNIDHISRELERVNDTLKQLDKTKSDFIAIAAHELKTPLTLIEGYAAMLRDQVPPRDELLQVRILLKGMDNGTRRLHEIVDDMIDVSLIDNNMLALHFQPIWLNRLLSDLSQEFSRAISERRQILEIRKFAGGEEMTFGDGERLYQAFRNIFSNAVKYTPDGGRITVDGRKLPGFIEIVVADTGIGIDSEDNARIFQKFGRLGSVSLHSSGKTKFKGGGPGLGLPITKGIIEAHGGTIWVESDGCDEVNCPGSKFHILLPIRKVPPDDKTARLFSPLSEVEGLPEV
jgi:signal transduction histidine kinase